MNDPVDLTGADREFEGALRSLSPASPGRSPSDAAYEAGRRDAMAQQHRILWIHRVATAAAIVIAGLLGAGVLLDEPIAAPGSANQLAHRSGPQESTGLEPAGQRSPFSYAALRSAVMSEGEIDLSQLPAGPTGESGGAPADVRSIGDLLREQQGM